MERLMINVKSQLINRGHSLRFHVLFFVILDLTLFLLPLSVCQTLDREVPLLVNVINLSYLLSAVYLLFDGIGYVNSRRPFAEQEAVRLAGPDARIRLMARLLANGCILLLNHINLFVGSSLMSKFADENHGYFQMNPGPEGAIASYFLVAFVWPMACHLLNLHIYNRETRLFSGLALVMLVALLSAYRGLCAWIPGWLVLTGMLAIFAVICWRAAAMEPGENA